MSGMGGFALGLTNGQTNVYIINAETLNGRNTSVKSLKLGELRVTDERGNPVHCTDILKKGVKAQVTKVGDEEPLGIFTAIKGRKEKPVDEPVTD